LIVLKFALRRIYGRISEATLKWNFKVCGARGSPYEWEADVR
jgi:hypothetical protein